MEKKGMYNYVFCTVTGKKCSQTIGFGKIDPNKTKKVKGTLISKGDIKSTGRTSVTSTLWTGEWGHKSDTLIPYIRIEYRFVKNYFFLIK